MRLKKLWDPKIAGPIPPGLENAPLSALKMSRKRYRRILAQYEARQQEIKDEEASS